MHSLVTLLALVALMLAAVPLVLTPPTSRVSAWLQAGGGTVTDSGLVATRSALQRISFLSLIVLLVAGVVVIVGDMPFLHLAAAGYALAAVVGSSVPVGGTERRRASLTPPESAGSARRAGGVALGLGALTMVMTAVLVTVLKARTPGVQGFLTLDESVVLRSAFGLADISSRQLMLIVIASLVLLVAVLASSAGVNRRQSAAGVDSRIDQLLRVVSLRRIAYAGLGGQAILLGATIPALQVPAITLTPSGSSAYAVSPSLVALLSAVGWLIIAAGVVVCVVAVLTPIWTRPKPSGGVSRRPFGSTGSRASVSSPATNQREI